MGLDHVPVHRRTGVLAAARARHRSGGRSTTSGRRCRGPPWRARPRPRTRRPAGQPGRHRARPPAAERVAFAANASSTARPPRPTQAQARSHVAAPGCGQVTVDAGQRLLCPGARIGWPSGGWRSVPRGTGGRARRRVVGRRRGGAGNVRRTRSRSRPAPWPRWPPPRPARRSPSTRRSRCVRRTSRAPLAAAPGRARRAARAASRSGSGSRGTTSCSSGSRRRIRSSSWRRIRPITRSPATQHHEGRQVLDPAGDAAAVHRVLGGGVALVTGRVRLGDGCCCSVLLGDRWWPAARR